MKTAAVVTIVIIVVILAALVWYLGKGPVQNTTQTPVSDNVNNPQPITQQNQNLPAGSLSTSASDSSDLALDKDVQTIDNGLSGLQADISSSQNQ